MRDFLMRHGLWAVRALCTLEFAFGLLLLRAYLKKKRVILLLMACMSFGLFYDALVLSVGNHLGHSALHGFSRLRFVFHGMLLPLMGPTWRRPRLRALCGASRRRQRLPLRKSF